MVEKNQNVEKKQYMTKEEFKEHLVATIMRVSKVSEEEAVNGFFLNVDDVADYVEDFMIIKPLVNMVCLGCENEFKGEESDICPECGGNCKENL